MSRSNPTILFSKKDVQPHYHFQVSWLATKISLKLDMKFLSMFFVMEAFLYDASWRGIAAR